MEFENDSSSLQQGVQYKFYSSMRRRRTLSRIHKSSPLAILCMALIFGNAFAFQASSLSSRYEWKHNSITHFHTLSPHHATHRLPTSIPALLSDSGDEECVTVVSEANDNDNNSEQSDSASMSVSNQEKSVGQQIFEIAIPALAGLAIDPLMTLADTVFVGRTSTSADALAGVGSAAALLTFSFYLFNFLCTVTTPLVSQRRASGDEKGAIEIGGQALSFAIILGVTLTTVLLTFSQPLLSFMGTSNTGPEANKYAMDFLTGRAIAAPSVFLISASTGVLRGYLDTKSAFVVLLGANVVNFLLDVILILGMDMGPKGAAIATTTAEWICAISFLLILAGKAPSVDGMLGSNQRSRRIGNSDMGYGNDLEEPLLEESDQGSFTNQSALNDSSGDLVTVLPTLQIPTWEAIKPLIVASSSVFVRSFMLQISIAGAAAMAARSGGEISSEASSASIAAHQIALQLWLLCSFVCDALAAASQALVADAVGRENQSDVRAVSKTIFAYSLGLGLLLASALVIGDLSGFLLNCFTTDDATQAALRPLLNVLILAQPLNAFVFTADGVLQGASAFSYQAKSMVLSASVAIGSFFTLQYFDGTDVAASTTLIHVWYSLVILQLMRGITSIWKLLQVDGPVDLLARNNV